MTASVLIPSFRRPAALHQCLRALAAQTRRPDQVVVVWQADDTPTRDAAEAVRAELPFRFDVLHAPSAGVVPAENAALAVAVGEVICLIDDDAVAPPDWVERHLSRYADPTVGAVGGSCDAFFGGGRLPVTDATPQGHITWYGRVLGNMHDQPPEWRTRPPADVTHLVGYNLTLRRTAFGRFEEGLRPYWQMFETDACLQVRRRGLRVLFDYGSVVEHYPSAGAYTGGRDGDLTIKIYNSSYNVLFVLVKHSPWLLLPLRVAYWLAVGSVSNPGLLAAGVAARRFGAPGRELRILVRSWRAMLAGLRDGLRRRSGDPRHFLHG